MNTIKLKERLDIKFLVMDGDNYHDLQENKKTSFPGQSMWKDINSSLKNVDTQKEFPF